MGSNPDSRWEPNVNRIAYKTAEDCYTALKQARSIILSYSPCAADADGLVFVEGYIKHIEEKLMKLEAVRLAAAATIE
jgi:hypothetical protein